MGKTGAILGLRIDCTGKYCEGDSGAVVLKRASDNELLCPPALLEDVITREEDHWRLLEVKFDIEKNTCDVVIGGKKIMDGVKFEGVSIPNTICMGVCGGTSHGKYNHICVNNVRLELDDDL